MSYSQTERQNIFDNICEIIIDGKSLRKALKEVGLPAKTFFVWLREDEQKGKQYARATIERAELMFEDMFEIADEEPERMETKVGSCIDSASIQNKRVRIDTRKWALSKMNPKKYSDKYFNDDESNPQQKTVTGTFFEYFEKVAGDWLQVRPFVGDVLNQITDFLFDDDKKVLMLAMPQGSGKSYIANKLTEWLLGDFQTQQSKRSNSVMRVCNTDSNVTKFQAAISNEIMGDGWRDFFGSHKLSNNNKNGMRFAGSWNDNAFFTSAKSSVMSRRADFLIFDDLYASMGEALSPSATSDYIMKFQTMWRGRLKGSDIGKIIMVGTRYAKNDFYQQVVDMYPESSTVINIPAINDDGESFCEDTHPIEELLHDRETMNIDLFNAIYQQNPTAEGFINPFKDWEPTFAPVTDNQFDYTCTVADPSFGVGGDFFMVGKFGYNRNGQAALLDLLCERVCSDEMYIQFIEKANCNRNFIEGNGVGGMLIKRVCNITRAPLFPFTSIGNKIERIYMNAKDIMKLTFSDKIENIPFDQMTDFGTADHDDFPDMLSHFFNNIKIYGK